MKNTVPINMRWCYLLQQPKAIYKKFYARRRCQQKFWIQKSTTFAHTNSKYIKDELKHTVPCAVAPKTVECWVIELTTHGRRVAGHHQVPGLKEISEIHALSWTRKHNIVKMSFVPKLTQSFDVIPTSLCRASVDLDSLILSMLWQRTTEHLLKCWKRTINGRNQSAQHSESVELV